MYKKPKDATRLKSPEALLLFVLPLPLIAIALGALTSGDWSRFLFSGLSLAGFYSAGALVRRSFRRAKDLAARKFVEKAPPPLRTTAALLTGASTYFAAMTLTSYHWAHAVLLSIGAAAGVLFAYGLDPRGTRLNLGDREEAAQAARTLAEAESKVAAIELANATIDCPELTHRLDGITHRAREILDLLAANPDQIRSARKFMQTYLEGAEKVISGYAATARHDDSGELDQKFANVLSTIDQVFAEQKQKLVESDVVDLDIQIEVLTTQMEREGVV